MARSAPSVAVIRAEEHILKLDIAMTAFLVCAPALLAGCKKSSADYTSQDEYSYESRDAFRTDMVQAIDKLEARTDELRTKVASGATPDQQANALIEETREGLADLRRELSYENTTQDNWNEFKSDFRRTLDDLGRKLEQAFDA